MYKPKKKIKYNLWNLDKKKKIRLQCRRPGFDPWVGKIPWRRAWQPTAVFWPGEFQELYSPWGCKESDRTERLSLHRGLGEGEQQVREPRTARPRGSRLGFYGDGISSQVFFGQSLWLRALSGGACIAPRWIPARRILGSGWTRGVSFCPFLNSSGWWRLISSVFFTRTSCHNITHTNGYRGTWPGWAVAVRVLPRTEGPVFYLLGLLIEKFAQPKSWELRLFGWHS